MTSAFNSRSPFPLRRTFYRKKGGVGRDRRCIGKLISNPLGTGCGDGDKQPFAKLFERLQIRNDVANAVSEVKRQAKRVAGNALYVDQRNPDLKAAAWAGIVDADVRL